MIVSCSERKPSTSLAMLARTLGSIARGEFTLKRLVKCAGSGSSNWSRDGRTLCVEFRVFVRVVADETISVFRENTSLGSIDVIIVAVLKGGRRRREGEGKETSVN